MSLRGEVRMPPGRQETTSGPFKVETETITWRLKGQFLEKRTGRKHNINWSYLGVEVKIDVTERLSTKKGVVGSWGRENRESFPEEGLLELAKKRPNLGNSICQGQHLRLEPISLHLALLPGMLLHSCAARNPRSGF